MFTKYVNIDQITFKELLWFTIKTALKSTLKRRPLAKGSPQKNVHVSQNNVFYQHKNNLVNFGTMIITLKLSLTYMT